MKRGKEILKDKQLELYKYTVTLKQKEEFTYPDFSYTESQEKSYKFLVHLYANISRTDCFLSERDIISRNMQLLN